MRNCLNQYLDLPLLKNLLQTMAALAMQRTLGPILKVCPNASEPVLVEKLVFRGTQELGELWWPIFASCGIKFRMTCVFCHGSPQVRSVTRKGGCELGDLLVCHFHSDSNNKVRIRTAKLLQAKKLRGDEYALHGGDLRQYRLYTQWKSFIYKKGNGLVGQRRAGLTSVTPGGLGYLLLGNKMVVYKPQVIDWAAFPTFPADICVPAKRIQPDNGSAWPEQLHNFVVWGAGAPFDSWNQAQKKKDWSRVVWDLIQWSLSSVKRPRIRSYSSFLRMAQKSSPVQACYLTGTGNEFLNDPGGLFKRFINSGDGANVPNQPPVPFGPGAPSLILFETKQMKDPDSPVVQLREICRSNDNEEGRLLKLHQYGEQCEALWDRRGGAPPPPPPPEKSAW